MISRQKPPADAMDEGQRSNTDKMNNMKDTDICKRSLSQYSK